MTDKLHWETVSKPLQIELKRIMQESLFDPFRLVGGTALSLYLGHRISVDIDLFTDSDYGSIDFEAIEINLKKHYPFVNEIGKGPVGMGKGYLIGNDNINTIKIDMYYTDPFIFPQQEIQGIRMASTEEIVAMKMDIVQRKARKKDFWDIHELLDYYSISSMIDLHKQRYPYTHDRIEIIKNFNFFDKAENEISPECFRGKHWEIIKLEINEACEKSGLKNESLKPKENLLPKKDKKNRRNKGLL